VLIADMTSSTFFELLLSPITKYAPGTKSYLKAQLALRTEELRSANTLINEQNFQLARLCEYCDDLSTRHTTALQQNAKEHQASLQHREKHITSLAHQMAQLKQENTALLCSISKGNNAMGPVNAETYYVDVFDSLNHLIQSSVARMFKRSCNVELSSDASSKVITLLASFNPCGTRTLEMLGSYDQNIAALHESAVPRMALVRHLIALVLWDKILRRFAFGLDAATNKNLRAIERELIAGNLQYNISDSRTGFRKSFGDPSSLRSSGTTSC
jgi:hypothetical protein